MSDKSYQEVTEELDEEIASLEHKVEESKKSKGDTKDESDENVEDQNLQHSETDSETGEGTLQEEIEDNGQQETPEDSKRYGF